MFIPRSEHPNPQWKRNNWQNLNGEWEFDFDFGNSALDKEMHKASSLPKIITVPFCPESELSGIGYTDFMNAVCYRKEFEITEDNLTGRIIIHFGAVDYKSVLFINEKKVGTHFGGYTSFEYDITDYVKAGKNVIFLHVADDIRTGGQCAGKQSAILYSHGCDYTRTTGIWQTVWLEFVPANYIKSAKFYPDIHTPSVTINGVTCGTGSVKAVALLDGKEVGAGEAYSDGAFSFTVKLTEKKLWEVGKGGLYDLKLTFGEDEVSTYFGLRSVTIDGFKVLINGKSVFQRLVLDQGFYPDGIYTAKNEEALINDIKISMDAGFNGARLHEKVFEPLYLYHADRLGYIVWGEYPDWTVSAHSDSTVLADYINGWTEAVNRDFNHPSIVGWCPGNELWNYYRKMRSSQPVHDQGRMPETLYKITKALDSTRPCIDVSGGDHSFFYDIYDFHDYTQDPAVFAELYDGFGKTGEIDTSDSRHDVHNLTYYRYDGKAPFFISEYGGIKWDVATADQTNNKKGSWGYGKAPESVREFIARYKGLTEVLLRNRNMFGFCYTQLYDVEQEKNGLYTYDRKPKFDEKYMQIIRETNMQTAEIEK